MDISPGLAATVIVVNTLLAKISMSVLWRAPTKAGEKKRKTDAFKNWSSAQMNIAEYDGPLLAMLLYLQAKGATSPWGCTLAVWGQVAYFWGRALHGQMVPFAPIGALPRYAALGILAASVYGTL